MLRLSWKYLTGERMIQLSDPLSLFSSLELKPDGQIKELWDSQIEVLDKYYKELKDEKRIAIELPTGSGKSIIGLLILEMWRRTGKRVAILTSSIALSEDMAKRCEDLGIESVVITGKRGEEERNIERVRKIKKYKRNQAIGIMNYWAYLLGRDIAEADVLVIDDADSFENLLIDQYSLAISRKEYEDIYDSILSELLQYRVYEKLEAFQFKSSRHEDIQLIYFTHALKMVDHIKDLIHAKGKKGVSSDLYWDFENNKNKMHTYLMFISNDNIVFTPYVTPGTMHDKLRNVDQIIYMSATLGTEEMIHKTMGSFHEIKIITEKDISCKIGTMGKRIIFPIDGLSTSLDLGGEAMNAILRLISKFEKILIFCNSYNDAYAINNALQMARYNTFIYKEEKDSRKFIDSPKGALITAGRFIGLDLPNEACRVAIMTKIPYVLGPTDVLIKNILEDMDYTNEKVSHRMVQAFGRCNRSPVDCAIYFVLDSTLASDILGEEKIFEHFPCRMKAEIDYGQEFTDGNLDKSIEIGSKLLQDELPNFESEVDIRIDTDIETIKPAYKKPYLKEILGWYDQTERQNYLDAIDHFKKCIASLSDWAENEFIKKQIAWYYYLIAQNYYLSFEYFKNPEYKTLAIENLNNAKDYGYTSWFSGLQTVIAELSGKEIKDEKIVYDFQTQSWKERTIRGWEEFKRGNSTKRRSPQQTWEDIKQTLLNGTHNSVCDKLKDVLELMGFEVRKLGKMTGEPDLIAFSNITKEKYLCIIEVKTKEKGDIIDRDHVDQISGNKSVYQSKYPDHIIYPMLYTNKEEFSDTAITKAKNDVRMLRSIEFIPFLNKYYELMEKGWNIKNPSERLALMEKIPALEEFQEILKTQEDPIIGVEELNPLVKW